MPAKTAKCKQHINVSDGRPNFDFCPFTTQSVKISGLVTLTVMPEQFSVNIDLSLSPTAQHSPSHTVQVHRFKNNDTKYKEKIHYRYFRLTCSKETRPN